MKGEGTCVFAENWTNHDHIRTCFVYGDGVMPGRRAGSGVVKYNSESPKQDRKRFNPILQRRSTLPILLYYLSMLKHPSAIFYQTSLHSIPPTPFYPPLPLLSPLFPSFPPFLFYSPFSLIFPLFLLVPLFPFYSSFSLLFPLSHFYSPFSLLFTLLRSIPPSPFYSPSSPLLLEVYPCK